MTIIFSILVCLLIALWCYTVAVMLIDEFNEIIRRDEENDE